MIPIAYLILDRETPDLILLFYVKTLVSMKDLIWQIYCNIKSTIYESPTSKMLRKFFVPPY